MWRDNLKTGTGERGTDTAFLRSFSALNLSVLAALDIDAPFMSQGEFDALLVDALEYLLRERDERGYLPGVGWVHASAHTADALIRELPK